MSSKEPALQFPAGKMKYANGIVSPDLRKGILSIAKHGRDFVKVTWSGRDSTAEEVFSWRNNQVTVSFVEQCTTGRVLLFKVNANGTEKLHFFWLQEKSTTKDDEYLKKIQSLFVAASGEQAQIVQLDDLKKILASISGKGSSDAVSLVDVLNSKKVATVVKENPDFFKTRLRETLPSELSSSEDIMEQIRHPQISHAAAMLEEGLRDPETCKELCRMYGLPENTAGVTGFLDAIAKAAKKE